MNSLTPTKVLVYLLFIFLAGAATGAVITWQNTRETPPQQRSMDKTCNRLQLRLKTKLGLTEEQLATLQPIFDQTARDLRAIRDHALRQTESVLCKSHEQMAHVLTPEQREKLEQLDQERRDWLEHRLHKNQGAAKDQ